MKKRWQQENYVRIWTSYRLPFGLYAFANKHFRNWKRNRKWTWKSLTHTHTSLVVEWAKTPSNNFIYETCVRYTQSLFCIAASISCYSLPQQILILFCQTLELKYIYIYIFVCSGCTSVTYHALTMQVFHDKMELNYWMKSAPSVAVCNTFAKNATNNTHTHRHMQHRLSPNPCMVCHIRVRLNTRQNTIEWIDKCWNANTCTLAGL